VQLPVALSQKLGLEMTFECWFQVFTADTRATGTPINRPIVSRFNTTVAAPPNRINDFNLQLTPEGWISFFVGGSNNYGILGQSVYAVEDNRWYFYPVLNNILIGSKVPRSFHYSIQQWKPAKSQRVC
jgi:hypothetical protein